ncbi:MAG TPA: exonuclease domain-containing protein, partial [Petrotogaceae bacterium]|nr:exonuclease domain-containing protein [Petrotogaceae bacterium]
MQALKDFWEERLGFDPFMINGSIEIKKDEASIYMETKINEQTEKSIRLLVSRMLKTNVSISCFKKMSLDEFADDWQSIISGNNLQEYLKLLYPQISEKGIVFKTSSSFAVERIKRMKESFDIFLHNCISGSFTYFFEIDESMKPTEAKKEFEPTNAKQSEKNMLLIGKDFKKLPMPIESIPMSEGSYIVTKGRIFSKEYNDKVRILTLYITDESASFIVKVMNDNAETLNSKIKVNDVILIDGVINRDNYINDYVIRPFNIKMDELPKRNDESKEKRVELHVHSKLSSMDGTMDIQNIVSIAKEFGHKAVAITDHGVVQSIPEFYDTAVSNCIKPIFGTESYVVDDFINIIKLFGPDREVDNCEYVVFDFETTGLIPWENEIIEIGAVKVKNNVVINRFHSLVKPVSPVPPNIVQITGITNEMVENERKIEQVLPEFLSFIENSVLVAHNADFDYRFLRVWIKKILNVDFEQTYIDTLSLSKSLLNLSGYSLDKVVQALGLGDFNHHRADEDAHVTALAFIKLIGMAKTRNLTTLKDFENLKKFIDYKSLRPFHMTILVKNKTGLKNLYRLISNSHIEHFYRVPRILKSELVQFREGLLIGSGCGFSEMAESFIRAADRAELVERAKFYDYIELMPIEAFESGDQISAPKVAEFYRLMYDISKELGIPAVMTGNVHYAEKGHKKFHDALRFNDKRQPTQALRYFRTTGEMLEQAKKIFNSDSIVKEVVIENSNKIADMIEEIKPLTKKLNPPKIEGAEETVKEMSLKKAIEL